MTVTSYYNNKKMPNLSLFSCCVLPGAFHSSVVGMFRKSFFTFETDPLKADLVVFTGGSDVHPQLYGEKPIAGCYTNERRDEYEKDIYEKCLAASIPMFGICRGLQFLHVMNGGKLYQDVTGHAGGNHSIIDLDNNEIVNQVSSIHHQMCRWDASIGMRLVAVSSVARSKHYQTYNSSLTPAANKTVEFDNGATVLHIPGSVLEVEAAVYPATLCFGVQGHPEICDGDVYQAWTMELIKDFLIGEVIDVAKTIPNKIKA